MFPKEVEIRVSEEERFVSYLDFIEVQLQNRLQDTCNIPTSPPPPRQSLRRLKSLSSKNRNPSRRSVNGFSFLFYFCFKISRSRLRLLWRSEQNLSKLMGRRSGRRRRSKRRWQQAGWVLAVFLVMIVIRSCVWVYLCHYCTFNVSLIPLSPLYQCYEGETFLSSYLEIYIHNTKQQKKYHYP